VISSKFSVRETEITIIRAYEAKQSKICSHHYYQKKLTFGDSSAQARAGSGISTTVDDTIGRLLLLAVPLRLPSNNTTATLYLIWKSEKAKMVGEAVAGLFPQKLSLYCLSVTPSNLIDHELVCLLSYHPTGAYYSKRY
jgi:hypothetical protein